MPSAYLVGAGDLVTFGVPAATTAAQIAQASLLVDTYLRRPEGLVYTPDSVGNPVFMTALVPRASFAIAAGLTPGPNQIVTMTGPINTLYRGCVIVADKGAQATCEAIVVLGVTGNQVTLANVVYAHASNATYSSGLTVFETKQLPSNRPLMILARNPVQKIHMAQGRYGYSRRGASQNYMLNEFNLLAVMSQFGGPPIWEQINVTITDINPQTGQIWIPAGIMLAYYSEVRVDYVCGYQYADLPDIIKLATANIINAQAATPLNGNLKLIKAGDTTMERFLDTVLDADTRLMLAGYRARVSA